jgi:photosystem II stability/assembly factor-like uncharacterized protein
VVAAVLLLVLTGCADAAEPGVSPTTTSGPTTPDDSAAAPEGTEGTESTEGTPAPDAAEVVGTPLEAPPAQGDGISHVHGVVVDPSTGVVHLGTHEGVFRYDDGSWTPVGPAVDLMGFAVTPDGRFYASGHPGPGQDLPDPLGLVVSRDQGETWFLLSRQGESDFHALAASQAGVVGFDGLALRTTSDGTTWRDLPIPVPPYDVGVSPSGAVLLATHQEGVLRSDDAGQTWSRPSGIPLLQLVHVVDEETVVGASPDGTVHLGDDATWTELGRPGDLVQALTAHRGEDGALQVVVVTRDAVHRSADGEPFERVAGL